LQLKPKVPNPNDARDDDHNHLCTHDGFQRESPTDHDRAGGFASDLYLQTLILRIKPRKYQSI
jgi:hypothetical protein